MSMLLFHTLVAVSLGDYKRKYLEVEAVGDVYDPHSILG